MPQPRSRFADCTIEIQAIFPNPEDILSHGMCAEMRAQIGVRHNALLVP